MSRAWDLEVFRVVALARGDRKKEAITAFRELVTSNRRSAHLGDVWLAAIRSRDRDEAASGFRAALGDPNQDVQKSVRDGLDALSKSKVGQPPK